MPGSSRGAWLQPGSVGRRTSEHARSQASRACVATGSRCYRPLRRQLHDPSDSARPAGTWPSGARSCGRECRRVRACVLRTRRRSRTRLHDLIGSGEATRNLAVTSPAEARHAQRVRLLRVVPGFSKAPAATPRSRECPATGPKPPLLAATRALPQHGPSGTHAAQNTWRPVRRQLQDPVGCGEGSQNVATTTGAWLQPGTTGQRTPEQSRPRRYGPEALPTRSATGPCRSAGRQVPASAQNTWRPVRRQL